MVTITATSNEGCVMVTGLSLHLADETQNNLGQTKGRGNSNLDTGLQSHGHILLHGALAPPASLTPFHPECFS